MTLVYASPSGVLSWLQQRAASRRAEVILGDLLLIWMHLHRSVGFPSIKLREPKTACAGNDVVQDGTAEAEQDGLSGDAADRPDCSVARSSCR